MNVVLLVVDSLRARSLGLPPELGRPEPRPDSDAGSRVDGSGLSSRPSWPCPTGVA